MNSFLKQIDGNSGSTKENFLELFEGGLRATTDISELNLIMKKLQFLGLNFDPFDQNVTTECREIIEQLKLTDHLSNPYEATNILLRLLDKTEEQLNNLKQ